jgi:hypothetical protein
MKTVCPHRTGDSLGRVVASLIVGGVFLLAMVIASVRGAVVLPADARIPVHAGSVEHCYLAPKRAGLVIWPGTGALVFGLLGGVAASSLATDWTAGVRDVLTPAVLGVLLAFQVGALVLARRGVAGGREGEVAGGREGGAGGPGQDGEGGWESGGRSG